MIYIKYVSLALCICCCSMGFLHAQTVSSENGSSSPSDYEPDEDEEFEQMLSDNDDDRSSGDKMDYKMDGRMMMVTGRAARDSEFDEFENFNDEFEKDGGKEFAGMDDQGKTKDDIDFHVEFGNEYDKDSSKEKDDGDEFYKTVKDDLDSDFNMHSSNKMDKLIKCDSPDDCESQQTSDKHTPNPKTEDSVDVSENRSSSAKDDLQARDDKTTIVYLSAPTTNQPAVYATTRRIRQYLNRPMSSLEEATNLKAEHLDDDHWTKPLECDCDVKAQPKIIGGSNAAKSKYPFAVAIFTLVGRGSFCGATIVNEKYVLTAAHCVQRHYRTPRNYNVVAGRTDLNISDILEDIITKASHIWLNGRLNDVALVRLAEPLDFSQAIKPACFGGPSIVPKDYSSSGYNKFGFDQSYFNNLENVSKHFKKTNRTLTAIGWGYVGWKVTKVNGVSKIRPIMTTKLQEVQLNEVICTKEDYLICVEGNGKSPCFGDSGSPLLFNHYEKMVVVGLTSRSSSAKAKHCLGAPTIYERSSYYLPWLKTLTSNRICLVD